jgi:hypothetical protein
LFIEQDKDIANHWKIKAISRGKENNFLRKRIKELARGRQDWKRKYLALKNSAKSSVFDGEKAARHQYSLAIVRLILEMHKYGAMSLRSCRNSLACMFVCFGISSRVPSHSTIRNWLCKGGFHRLKTAHSASGDYVVYVDESIVFGSEKILLILGVASEKIPKNRALIHNDIEVLYVGANAEWKAAHIEAELSKIAQTKRILYAVSDEGHNLCKAYKSLNYVHIEDCTHILANFLKRLYDKDQTFEGFRKLIGDLRKKWNLSKENSRFMPPMMRGKLRFANIFPCIHWSKLCLENWENLSETVKGSLIFLKKNEAFIAALVEISKVFKMLCEKLKNEGFGICQKAAILAELALISASAKEEKLLTFIENCKGYLDNLSKKTSELGLQHLLASSDIIESFFGKFKSKIKANNRSGLTEFIFTIANFSQIFSQEETKMALENVKLKDLILNKNRTKTNDS